MSRDPDAAAAGWCFSALAGVHTRPSPVASVPACVVRGTSRGWMMRVGGGREMPAGATLAEATSHAAGHAEREGLRARRGGDDLCGPCATCRRLTTGGEG